MAKKVTGVVKLQIPAGAANPAPPVGPALGSAGVNIMQFCKELKDNGLNVLANVGCEHVAVFGKSWDL